MTEPFVLIVDDEDNLVASLVYGLKAHGIEAEGAPNAATGLAALERLRPDVVLLDLRLPDSSGMDVLATIKSRQPDLPVIMISAHGDIRVAVEAVKMGAGDFITKPFELDEVVHLIRKTAGHERLSREVAYRRRQTVEEQSELVGTSAVIAELREQLAVIARSAARTVLLLGQSGTGKGLVARMVHAASPRASGPFIGLNCASLPENLLEAELFGAERGAYTGAYQKRPGLVELAEAGTLFLDEIGEVPLGVQAKLLRFLENRSFRPIGGARERNADVRVVAATNRNLEDEVKAGRFRADLFYRLNVVPITIPPLAGRTADILLLAEHFAKRQAEAEGCARILFADATRERLACYVWHGNIRELKNLIERLTILYPGRTIEPAQLPAEFNGTGTPAPDGIEQQLQAAERDILLRALRQAEGRKGKAAESLGISRHAFKRRLQRFDMS